MDSEEIQMQINEVKDKYEKKLEKEREQHRKNVEFLKNQIELKDERITKLLTMFENALRENNGKG